ncbi:MAG: hypothetical protein HYV26_20820 [Candidatus Hydrogenedentes bacterium]|nr:hypothetical protein [Candidatus Hydrogenedentota bacterium]
MSETVRSFTRPGLPRTRRRAGGLLRYGVLALLLLCLLWAGWVTRDAQPLHALVPVQQDYRVFINDFLNKRTQIATSEVWALAPEGSAIAQIPAQLSSNFGMPEWVLNNLIYGVCLLSGNDLQTFSDILLVTRMTRVGCLIEHFHNFLPGIDEDPAGGLNLRFVPESHVYYAVRGRVLIASPSRDALIRSLTLTADQALGEAALEEQINAPGAEDLNAHLRLGADDPLGDVFEELWVALRLGPAQAQLRCRGGLQPAWRRRFEAVLADVTPQSLRPAPEGLLTLSANVGKPLPEVWAALNEAWPEPWGLHQQLFGWLDTRQGTGASVGTMLAGLLAQTGPAWALSWHGIDTLAMIPTPEIVAVLQADPSQLEQVFANWPEPPVETPAWESVPRYDAARQVVYLPMPGGPSLEPTAAIQGNGLFLSSSRRVAGELLSKPVAGGVIERKGNLTIDFFPQPALQAVVDAGLEFAHFGALRGYTVETFQAAADRWLATAQKLKRISVFALHDQGVLEAELTVEMNPRE